MTASGRKYFLSILVCSMALIAGCGGGGSSSSTGGPLSISTASPLPNGNVGTSYSSTVVATGGTAPYTWSLASGTLQAGLALNSGTGTINGTPTASGTVSVKVQVTDAATPTADTAMMQLSLTVQNLNITTASPLPAGSLQTSYSTTVTATGATAPYTWSVTAGALPAGLSLCTGSSTTCAISGIPTGSGLATFTLQVADSESPAVTFAKSFTITISPLAVLNSSLPNGLQGNSYGLTLNGVGGVSPYTWSVSQGTPPGGLNLNSTTGAITGTPTGFGTFDFTIHVVDSETPPEVATKSFAITVVPASGSCAGTPTGNESLLNGNYAFLAQGLEGGGAGTPVAIAASFAANAAGAVTGGDIDVSDAIGATHYTIAPGSALSLYTVGPDPNPTHAGNLGCVMLTTSTGAAMAFRFALGGVTGGIASKGKIIEFDDTSGSGTIASGIIALQQTSSFSASHLSPNYAFGLDGQTLGGSPLAEAGFFAVSSTGAISNAAADVDIAGTNSSALSGGSGTITGISSTNGRATASFTISGTAFAWTAYIVNSNEAYLVSTAFPAGGRALATAGPFSQTSLSGNYLAYSTGIATSTCSGLPCSDVNLGLLNLSGGAASGTLWDYNIPAGESQATVSGGTYAVTAASGRAVFSGVGSNGLVSYLVSPAVDGINGMTVGTDAGAHSGFLTLQAGTIVPAEQLIYGTLDPRYNTVTTYAGTAGMTALGAFAGTENDSGQSGLHASLPVARTVNLSSVNGTGSASRTGGSSIAVTDGTRIFWFDFGDGAPPVITVAKPQ